MMLDFVYLIKKEVYLQRQIFLTDETLMNKMIYKYVQKNKTVAQLLLVSFRI